MVLLIKCLPILKLSECRKISQLISAKRECSRVSAPLISNHRTLVGDDRQPYAVCQESLFLIAYKKL